MKNFLRLDKHTKNVLKNNTNKMVKEKLKDHYFQVSYSLLEIEPIEDILNLYGSKGLGLWLIISMKLLKNNGRKKYDWKYFMKEPNDKEAIEYIIEKSGLCYMNNDGTFGSYEIDEQIQERMKIIKMKSEAGKISANKRYQNKSKASGTSGTSGTSGNKRIEQKIEKDKNSFCNICGYDTEYCKCDNNTNESYEEQEFFSV